MQFLNISNHPSSSWTPAQVEAARALGGEPADVGFPNVDPSWSTSEIEDFAIHFAESLDLEEVGGAMVAGEPLFAVLLVRELQKLNVACYTATTERGVEERDGQKISRFSFVRFREWPSL
jgi:hypothetical protein